MAGLLAVQRTGEEAGEMRPGDPSLHLDQELDITPKPEGKGWLVEARRVVSEEWAATILASILSAYGMEVEIRLVGGDEGEGEPK